MEPSLRDRVALVTGAGGAIGRAVALRLARDGARLVISDLAGPGLDEAAAALLAGGHQAVALPCQLTDHAALEGVVDAAAARWGRLDILVNNAGFQHVAPLETFPTDRFQALLQVMLVAPFVAIKRAFPIMRRQGGGRIINVASINGLVGFAGKAGYNSAKHGLLGLTKVAALEGAPHGITVNALCPGYVDTPLVRNQLSDLARTRGVALERVLEEVIYPLVPMRRLLAVEEVAGYLAFLASDEARGVTGAAAILDGGYTAQ